GSGGPAGAASPPAAGAGLDHFATIGLGTGLALAARPALLVPGGCQGYSEEPQHRQQGGRQPQCSDSHVYAPFRSRKLSPGPPGTACSATRPRADSHWNGSENFGSVRNFGSLRVFRKATRAVLSCSLRLRARRTRPSRLGCGWTSLL